MNAKAGAQASGGEIAALKAKHAEELARVRTRAKETLQLARSQLEGEVHALRLCLGERKMSVDAEVQTASSHDSQRIQATAQLMDSWRQECENTLADTSEQLELLHRENKHLLHALENQEAEMTQMHRQHEAMKHALRLGRSKLSEFLMSNQPIDTNQLHELKEILNNDMRRPSINGEHIVSPAAIGLAKTRSYRDLADQLLRRNSSVLSMVWYVR